MISPINLQYGNLLDQTPLQYTQNPRRFIKPINLTKRTQDGWKLQHDQKMIKSALFDKTYIFMDALISNQCFYFIPILHHNTLIKQKFHSECHYTKLASMSNWIFQWNILDILLQYLQHNKKVLLFYIKSCVIGLVNWHILEYVHLIYIVAQFMVDTTRDKKYTRRMRYVSRCATIKWWTQPTWAWNVPMCKERFYLSFSYCSGLFIDAANINEMKGY
jgi:hypothetical protein